MSKSKINAREALKQIPSIDEILIEFPLSVPIVFYKYHINKVFNQIRNEINSGFISENIREYCFEKIKNLNKSIANNSLNQVINGTGIILHTGLGRAPISKEILIDGITKNYPYSNLELDLENGKRGDRNSHIATLINTICKSENSLIVNNNAAAVILMLNSISQNKEIIVSRGQLVEIGGSFRIPDIMVKSKCKMIEVGTTNKTHIKDYSNAVNSKTSAILYVHTSNYKVIGFSSVVEIHELSKIAKQNNIPLLVDLGSGSIIDFKSMGLPMDKIVSKYIKEGADVVTFSGDKLLGGPQGGIITGKNNFIKKMYENPLYRAFRYDKIRLSIMETILRTYYSSTNVSEYNLTISLFKRSKKDLYKIGQKILKNYRSKVFSLELIETTVEAGSGSLPTEKIPSYAIEIISDTVKPLKIYNKFLKAKIPIIGYIKANSFRIDLRAIPEDQIKVLMLSIKECLI